MTGARARVSVVVLNYNGEGVIEKCLDSILRQDYPNFETIVVDNCSSDNSVNTIQRFLPRVKLVQNRRNLGYTGGLNAGCSQVSEDCELVAIVTNDVVLSYDWLRHMVDVASSDVSVGAVSCQVYELRAQSTITELRIIYPTGTVYTPWNKKNACVQEIDCPSGQAFVVRKRIFRSVGEFDADYFAYYDDADLGWRIRLQGYRVVLNPRATIIHRGHHAFGKFGTRIPTAHILSERNRMLACIKNLAATSLPAFAIAEAFNVLYRTLRGILRVSWRPVDKAYILALVGFAWKLRGAWEKRLLVQQSRRRSDREIFSMSLPRMVLPTSRKEFMYRSLLDIVSRIFPAR